MRAVSLVGVLVLAKVLGLAGRALPVSIWLPSAVLWQDVAVGVVFWMVDRLIRRPRIAWTTYWLIVAWAALNVVITRELSSPLTVPMLRATGAALTDSIAYYLTAANVALMGSVLAAGATFPLLFARPRVRQIAAVIGLTIALPGPFVARAVDTRGAQRNAVTALIATSLPRLGAPGDAVSGDLRATPFDDPPADDLSALAGAGVGRNIVLIVLESTGAQYLRSYGAADDPMPTMTALAGEAVQFESAYAVYPESVKGVFALLCSQAPAFDVPVHVHANAPCTPLARVLSEAGYRTGLFHSGRFGYLGMDALIARQGFDTMEDAGAIGGNVESSFGVDEPATVTRMLAWIDGPDRRRPFFLLYMPVAGHHPYATARPGPFTGPGALAAYQNALREGDDSLAVLLDGLRARQLDQRTMVVAVGDHGEAFGQHDGNYGHTLFAYDENVRVPLLIAVPGVTTRPIRARQVASVIDSAPTILDIAGIAVPAGLEGGSLLEARSRLAFFYTDYALGWVGLRDGCWKYLLEIDANRPALYDVCADPGETRNLAAGEPVRVGVYRDRVLAWLAASRSAVRAEQE